MAFELPALPYEPHALSPHLSAETLRRHYEGYHRACIEGLNARVAGTDDAARSLEALLAEADGERFHLAAEAWNHAFHWHCLTPGGAPPSGALAEAIERRYGSLTALQTAFNRHVLAQLGPGWAWLVKDDAADLTFLFTQGADTAIARGYTPLLAIDLWEHAYLLDHGHDRLKYLESLWPLINWDFVAQNFE